MFLFSFGVSLLFGVFFFFYGFLWLGRDNVDYRRLWKDTQISVALHGGPELLKLLLPYCCTLLNRGWRDMTVTVYAPRHDLKSKLSVVIRTLIVDLVFDEWKSIETWKMSNDFRLSAVSRVNDNCISRNDNNSKETRLEYRRKPHVTNIKTLRRAAEATAAIDYSKVFFASDERSDHVGDPTSKTRVQCVNFVWRVVAHVFSHSGQLRVNIPIKLVPVFCYYYYFFCFRLYWVDHSTVLFCFDLPHKSLNSFFVFAFWLETHAGLEFPGERHRNR